MSLFSIANPPVSAHSLDMSTTPDIGDLSCRERFCRACRCEPVDHPPVWLMRQAGRSLPEYRALREKFSFLQLVQTPDLAVEVTLQPVRRFGFDAAILFSDILVIPEAMGQPYAFRDGGGITMDFSLHRQADIDRLSPAAVLERLEYVHQALVRLRGELGDRTGLIGFAGSPWTLASFMCEGGSATQFTRALALFREERHAFNSLMEKLTEAVTHYLEMQIRSGVDAVQIFDSLGGLLPASRFEEASGSWMRRIIDRLGGQVPVIVFSKGTRHWPALLDTGARVIGIDHEIPMADARHHLPECVALQGNVPPALMSDGTPESVAAATRQCLDAMRGRHGHIVNLGHGLTPGARLENIAALVDTVRAFE